MPISSTSTHRMLLRFRSLGKTFPCGGWGTGQVPQGIVHSHPLTPCHLAGWERNRERSGGAQRSPHPDSLPSPRTPKARKYLSLLGPERGLQLSSREQPILQAGQKGQQVSSLREVQRRPLDAVLADQHERAATLCRMGGAGGHVRLRPPGRDNSQAAQAGKDDGGGTAYVDSGRTEVSGHIQ